MPKEIFYLYNIILFASYYFVKTKDKLARMFIVFLVATIAAISSSYVLFKYAEVISSVAFKNISKVSALLIFCGFIVMSAPEIEKRRKSGKPEKYLDILIPKRSNYIFWIIAIVTNIALLILIPVSK